MEPSRTTGDGPVRTAVLASAVLRHESPTPIPRVAMAAAFVAGFGLIASLPRSGVQIMSPNCRGYRTPPSNEP